MSNVVSLPGVEPTGEVAYPFVLIEGDESAGKTTGALALARHPRIRQTFALELGESKLHQYKRIAPYRVLEHNGTTTSIRDQFRRAIAWCRANPIEDPTLSDLIIFDGGTALWELEKRRIDARTLNAARRRAEQQRRMFDPDGTYPKPSNAWPEARDRWYSIINMLREWDGIVVITARGKESIVLDDDGKPIKDEKTWKVQTEGNLKFEVDAWVTMRRPHKATLSGCKALDVDVPDGGIVLDGGDIKDNEYCGPLAPVIFDMIGAGIDRFGSSTHVYACVGRTRVEAKQEMVAMFSRACDEDVAKEEAGATWWAWVGEGNTEPKEINDDQWSALVELVSARIGEIAESKIRQFPNGSTPDAFEAATDQTAREPVEESHVQDEADEADQSERAAMSDDDEQRRNAYWAAHGLLPPAKKPTSSSTATVSLKTQFVNMGSEVGRRLTAEQQIEFLKWLKSEKDCGPMSVRWGDVDDVRSVIDKLSGSTEEPFNESNETLAPKASKADVEKIRTGLRSARIIGGDRFTFVADIIGRTIKSLDALRADEAQKILAVQLQRAQNQSASKSVAG